MPKLSSLQAAIGRHQITPIKGFGQVRPWVPQLTGGAHIDAAQTTEVTMDNYKRWAYNQIEEMNKTQDRRLSPDTVDYVVDRFRQIAGGESKFAIDHWAAAKEHMAQNPLIAAHAGAMKTMAATPGAMVGIFSPETADNMMKNVEATYGPSPGVGGFIGSLIGTAATMIPALLTGAAGASAAQVGWTMAGQIGAQGFGGSRLETHGQREAGHEIGYGQEFGAALATGLVEGASGYVSYRLFRLVGAAAGGMGPGGQAAARQGGKKGLRLYLERGLNMIPGMSAEAGEEGITQIIDNAIATAFSIDPDRDLTEGAAEAALSGFLLSPLLGPVAAYKGNQRAQAMEKGDVVPPGQTPQKGQMPVQIPQAEIRKQGQVDSTTVDTWESDADEGDMQPYTFTQEPGQGDAGPGSAAWIDKPPGPQPGLKQAPKRPLIPGKTTPREAAPGPDKHRTTRSDPQDGLPRHVTVQKVGEVTVTEFESDTDAARESTARDEPMTQADWMEYRDRMRSSEMGEDTEEGDIDPDDDFEDFEVPDFGVEEDPYRDDPVGDPSRRRGHDFRTYIMKIDGEEALMDITISEDGESVFFNWLGKHTDAEQGQRARGKGGANTLGDARTKKLFETLGKMFPRLNRVSGTRGSGMRRGGKKQGALVEKIFREAPREWIQTTLTSFGNVGQPTGPVIFTQDGDGVWGNDPDGGWGRDDDLPPQNPIEPLPGGHERPGINLGTGIEDTISPLSYVLNKINSYVGGRLTKFEASTKVKTAAALRTFGRFGKGKRQAFKAAAKQNAKGKTRRQYRKELNLNFDNAVGNGDFERAARILTDVAISPEHADALIGAMNEVRTLFADLRAKAIAAGNEVGMIDQYWPRNVRDHKKYMEDLRPGDEAQSLIDEKIAEVMRRKKRKLTYQEQVAIANQVIQGFGPQLPGRGVGSRNFKQRKVAQVPLEHQYLYRDSDYAAVNYITRTIEATEAGKFFGKKGKKGNVVEPGDIATDVEDSIGEFLVRLREEGRVSVSQENRIRELLMSRFRGGMQSPDMFFRTFRDIGYAVTIGNPLSALVQFGDIGLAAVENGLYYTARGVRISLSTMVRQAMGKDVSGRFTLNDIGLTDISADFGSVQQTAKFVDFMMKWSGFKFVDGLGKLTHVNASWLKFQDIVKDPTSLEFKQLQREWQTILGEDFDATIRDIRAGKQSENVLMMMMAQVMKIQPVALSEMPKRYLDMTNGRVLYMLKTFTVKQTNYLRQRSLDKMYYGAVTSDYDMVGGAFKELLRFAMLFGMAGAGVDLLKKFLLGHPIETDDLTDITQENLLKTFGSSKFLMNQVEQKGPAAAFWGYIMPPMGFITDTVKDAQRVPEFAKGELDFDDVKSTRNLPLIGKFIYQRYGGGAEYNAKERRSRRTKKRSHAREEAMQAIADGDAASAGAIIAHYNANRPEGMKPITGKGIRQSLKSKAQKAAQEAAE